MKRNLVFLFVLACTIAPTLEGQTLTGHPATDVYDGWHLGMQAYTFNKYSFYEAVDKAAELGLSWIEAFPWQVLSPENDKVKFDYNLSAEQRQAVKKKLASAGVRLINFYYPLTDDEKECRRIFSFVKDMAVETIVSEPPVEAMELIDRLAGEYRIRVAIHNHPRQADYRYWNPREVMKVVADCSRWIGVCADTGHWLRSGIKPIDALQIVKERLMCLHLKDLNGFGKPEYHDVPWGTGNGNIKGILQFLHQQKFTGVISIEYEYNWYHSIPEIRRCIRFYDQVVRTWHPTGWKNLLADKLANCNIKPGGWSYRQDVLAYEKGGYCWVKDAYENFILDLQFKLAPATNSGILIRNSDYQSWRHHGMEVQILDSYGHPLDSHICGAIYDCYVPKANMVKKPGQWNHMTIMAQKNKIIVVLNGVQIVDMDLNRWNRKGYNPDGTKNKFPQAMKQLQRAGYIGFQDHGHKVWFRNLKIKPL